MPLGDPYRGTCLAEPETPFHPDEDTLRQLCNLGYVYPKCSRFPKGGGPDAVRFSVSHDRQGVIGLYCVIEKDHRPYAHGPLEYSRAAASFTLSHPNEVVQKQAQAYLESYLRRKPATA